MAKIRTLVLHPAIAPYRIDLFNRLAGELDLRVGFLQRRIKYDPNAEQQELLKQLRCDYRVLEPSLRIADHDIRFGIVPELRSFRPEVVVSHEFSHSTFLCLSYRRANPERGYGLAIWTEENVTLLKERGLLRKALLHMGSKLGDSVIVYSRQMLDELASQVGLQKKKLFVCANHEDERRIEKKLDEALPTAQRYVHDHGLNGKVVLLSVGRLAPVKNTGSLLVAYSRIARSHPDSILVIVGDGPLKNELAIKAEELGISEQVLFTGYLKGADLYAWFRLASLFVLASTFEPYGAVVCEALISGIPVLVSSVAGAGVLVESGKNGSVFNPLDTGHLASLLEEGAGNGVCGEKLVEMKRRSLMPVPFERDVESFVSAVHHAARCEAVRRKNKLQ